MLFDMTIESVVGMPKADCGWPNTLDSLEDYPIRAPRRTDVSMADSRSIITPAMFWRR